MDIQSFTLLFDRPSPFEPPPDYARLRADGPVLRTITASGVPAWVVIGADTAQQVLSDRRFAITEPGAPVDAESLLSDGPEHARLRRVIAKGLDSRTVAALRARFETAAAGFVADLRRAGPPAELVSGLARPLILDMITELLGVPVDDRAKFYGWAEAASMSPVDAESYAETWMELMGFLSGLIEARRATPGTDLLSGLVAAQTSTEDGLNDRELLLAAVSLLSGGQLTTVNALSIGLIKLLDAGRLAGLDDRAATSVAVEEMLRHQAGISGEAFPRWALQDVEVGGATIAAGDMVIVRFEAANRDPERFPDPDRFDPARPPRPNLRFGHGPHRCIGAAMARAVLVAAVGALATQLPGLRLVGRPQDIPWTDNPLDGGPAELPVTW